jgi:hypothetical protein
MAAHHQVRNAAGRNGVRLGLSPRGLLKANDPRRTVNDFAELSILLEVAICLDHFAEHEGPIDDRPEGARLESLGDVLNGCLAAGVVAAGQKSNPRYWPTFESAGRRRRQGALRSIDSSASPYGSGHPPRRSTAGPWRRSYWENRGRATKSHRCEPSL